MSVTLTVLAIVGLVTVGPATATTSHAQNDPEQQLAERYAPVMMLKAQDGECDAHGEPFAPMDVELVLDNRDVLLRQVGRDDPVVMRAPGAADLAGLGAGFYIDIAGDSLSPECVYEQAFRAYTADTPALIYAHIVTSDDPQPQLFLQYWTYWLYNDWNNKHESDWEGITVVFDAASVDEALAEEPVAVGFSQHEGGERADWDDQKLERVDGRPVVYSSAGSHASYFGSAVYLGRGAAEGFGCDDTTGPSVRVDPEVVVLPDRVDDPDDPLAWLAYEGRWGERQSGPFNGPTGPTAKDRWLEPAPWFDELRSSSVVIPAGDGPASSVISSFCGVVEFGSGLLIATRQSPQALLIPFGVIAVLAVTVVRRTEWDRVPVTPLVQRRRAGQIIRASWHISAARPLTFLAFGLLAIPAAVAAGVIAATFEQLPILGDLANLAGRTSGANLVFAVLAGSVANLAAFMTISTMVAHHLTSEGDDPGAAASARWAWERRSDLATAVATSWLVVTVLFLTVVGTPWAIRQLVRYQHAPQAIAIEGTAGTRALQRSTELVEGRWWHTAGVAIGINLLAGGTAVVVGMLLLVTLSIPLWLFSGLVTLVYATTSPLAAIAMTSLYGDARADREHRPEPALVGVD